MVWVNNRKDDVGIWGKMCVYNQHWLYTQNLALQAQTFRINHQNLNWKSSSLLKCNWWTASVWDNVPPGFKRFCQSSHSQFIVLTGYFIYDMFDKTIWWSTPSAPAEKANLIRYTVSELLKMSVTSCICVTLQGCEFSSLIYSYLD